MTNEQKMEVMGDLGEKFVINWLSSKGHRVETSIDKFDREKDLTVYKNGVNEGLIIEVKTQVPFIKENAFTFKPNQLKKIQGCDCLFLITAAAPRHKYKHENRMFQVNPQRLVIRKYKTSDGRLMLLADMDQPAVTFIKELSDDEAAQVAKYTNSKY